MQRGREGRADLFEVDDPFSMFHGFGSRMSMMQPSLFQGRDPFDDPFFTRPFGSIFEPSIFGPRASSSNTSKTNEAKGIVIEELNSDEEGEKEEDKSSRNDKDNCNVHSGSSKEPSIEHPDDDVGFDEGKSKSVNRGNQQNKVEGAQSLSRNFCFQTCKVTYGGVDGAYYTSTRTRRTGSDGVVLEESKEADKTTGQATHRISKGILDKGHSVTRKLNSDGKVDTVQTLHNMNEDELAGFQESWKGSAKPGWGDGFDMHSNTDSRSDGQTGKATCGGWMLPSTEGSQNAGGMISDKEARSSSSLSRTKKVVRINIE